jgi:hypothetical protein
LAASSSRLLFFREGKRRGKIVKFPDGKILHREKHLFPRFSYECLNSMNEAMTSSYSLFASLRNFTKGLEGETLTIENYGKMKLCGIEKL